MNTEVALFGLDAANPLAYLAALGALRTLTLAWPDRRVKITWSLSGKWMPILGIDGAQTDQEAVLDALYAQLSNQQDQPHFTLMACQGEPLVSLKSVTPAGYRRFAAESASSQRHPSGGHDFAAAWGSEMKTRRKKDTTITPTGFDFTAGQQGLLHMVRETISMTTREHLLDALVRPWRYVDDGLSLRWDLLDETRQYALMAVNPTDTRHNPIKTMRGANRLAIEALPLFPVIPSATVVQTTGFSEANGVQTWTWPVWHGFLDVNVVRSLLAHAAFKEPEIDRNQLNALGVQEIYRSRVVMPAGRYRCFAPPQAV